MIVVKIMGGLGNQLFQYALGRNLAIKNNTELRLDITWYEKIDNRSFKLNYFSTEFKIAKANEIPYLRKDIDFNLFKKLFHKIAGSKTEIYEEQHFCFDETILKAKKNSYFFGYWQSDKYFTDIASIIKADLKLKKKETKKIHSIANLIKESHSISLHIRRGDYIDSQTHPILSVDYYIEGIRILKQKLENPILFIFSDDIKWCKANLHLKENHYFIDGNEDWEDLYLISLCKNHIIANSSFSWWGAWLSDANEKMVIAPKKWFTPSNYITKDLLPQNWIKV
jgi:hypothetical protein